MNTRDARRPTLADLGAPSGYLCADPRLTVEEHARARREPTDQAVATLPPGHTVTADDVRRAVDGLSAGNFAPLADVVREQQERAAQRDFERAALGPMAEASWAGHALRPASVSAAWLKSYRSFGDGALSTEGPLASPLAAASTTRHAVGWWLCRLGAH